jgi:hypothetical protein
MNLYRITVRSQDGTISDQQMNATSVRPALVVSDDHSAVLKVEQIDPVTGEVLASHYSNGWVDPVA